MFVKMRNENYSAPFSSQSQKLAGEKKIQRAFSTLGGLRGPSVAEPLVFLRPTALEVSPGHPGRGDLLSVLRASGQDKHMAWCLPALPLDTDLRRGKRTFCPVFI